MATPDPDLATLREAHLAALTGCLIDGVERGPGGAGYAWSRTIPDPTLNFAFGVRTDADLVWAGARARAHGRDLALLADDAGAVAALRPLFAPAAAFPAAWMLADADPSPLDEPRLSVEAGPVPSADFEAVFANLSEIPAVEAHLRRYYLPALRAARAEPGVAALHLVLRDAEGPVACASLYRRGDLAGLYNVSTRADRQRRGHGARLTALALRAARGEGAAHVFLQCPAAGPVEALYARAGFRTVRAPVLLCAVAP